MIVIGGLGSITRLGPRRGPLHLPDRGAARVRAVPDGPLLAPADRPDDRAAAGDPGPQRVRDVPDQAAPLDRRVRPARPGRPRRSRRGASSSSPSVTMRFGGLVRRQRARARDRAGPALRPDRPERRRQDDRLQRDHRRLHADLRRDRVRGRRDRGRALRPDHAPRHRADVPEHPPLRRDVGARQRQGRVRLPAGDDADDRGPAHARATGRRRRGSTARAASCSRSSSSTTSPTSAPRTCPTAASAASRSRARWRPRRASCCSTSRPPA